MKTDRQTEESLRALQGLSPDGQDEERLLRAIEEEIRTAGEPFAQPRPDPIYWASFRTRVFEQVEASSITRQRGLHAVWSWIAEHSIVSGSIGLGLAAVVVLLLNLGTPVTQLSRDASHIGASSTPQIAQALPPASEQHHEVSSTAANVERAAAPVTAMPDHSSGVRRSGTKIGHARTGPRPEVGEDMAALPSPSGSTAVIAESVSRPTMVGSEADYPVSLNELSTSELKAVYEGLESNW